MSTAPTSHWESLLQLYANTTQTAAALRTILCSVAVALSYCSNSPFQSLFKQKAGIIFMRELVPVFPNCHRTYIEL